MNKSYLFVALLACTIPQIEGSAQTTASTRKPIGISKAPQMRPELKRILQVQTSQQQTAQQKTTAAELLIGTYSFSNEMGSMYYDSTKYTYSGTRGSNLTNDINSYFDNFYPEETLVAQWNFSKPTLLFDTSTYYVSNNGSNWNREGFMNRNYDAANNVTLQHYRGYDNAGTLAEHNYTTVAYDALNNITNATVYWDTSMNLTGTFLVVNNLQAFYAASTTNRTHDTFSYSYGFGVQKQNTLYSYNTAGKLISSISKEYDSFTGTWEDDERYTYGYDGNGRLHTGMSETWSNGMWELSSKDSFGYTGSAAQYTFHENTYYNGGMFSFAFVEAYTLNSFQAPDTVYSLESNTQGIWDPIMRGKLTYNNNQHLTHFEGVDFDASSGSWNTIPNQIIRWHYATPNSVKNVKNAQEAFAQLYPNPSSNSLNFKIENPQGRVGVDVYNLSGQLLQSFSQPAAGLVQLDITSLPAGTYLATINMNGNVQHSQFIKQ